MNAGRLKRFTATGDVNAGTHAFLYLGFTVSPGTTTTTVTLRTGGSGGTVIWQGVFAANASPVAFPTPFICDGLHVTISGTGAEASFVY